MTTVRDIAIPDIGDFKDVLITELKVKSGDTVREDDPLLVVESDKAALEIPSPDSGTVVALKVAVGDRVNQGTPILVLRSSAAEDAKAGAAPPPATETDPAPHPDPAPAPASRPPEPSAPAGRLIPRASPSLRKFARKLGLDLAMVAPSGPRGRLRRDDVEHHVKAALAATPGPAGGGRGLELLAWPQVDFAKFGPIERQSLSKIRRLSGANLARNWAIIPHVTNFEDADITDLEAFRKQINREQEKAEIKLTLLPFLIKALAATLKRHPQFNASLDGDDLILKGYVHIGFAADTPHGLVVPVIRDADRKGLLDIAREAAALAALAREGKLKPSDMQGGSITLSSLGGIGGTNFTPIINAPEIAILGVVRAQTRPVWDGTQFQPRLILPLSLSWDHRALDGVAAARFLVDLAGLLGDFRRITL
jgi:pyruvate dehydrogenase E2 component (dihydrolipoamide acetyltransferase)